MFFRETPHKRNFSDIRVNAKTVNIQPMDVLGYYYDRLKPFLKEKFRKSVTVNLSGALPPVNAENKFSQSLEVRDRKHVKLLENWIKINMGKSHWEALPGVIASSVDELLNSCSDESLKRLADEIVKWCEKNNVKEVTLYCGLVPAYEVGLYSQMALK